MWRRHRRRGPSRGVSKSVSIEPTPRQEQRMHNQTAFVLTVLVALLRRRCSRAGPTLVFARPG